MEYIYLSPQYCHEPYCDHPLYAIIDDEVYPWIIRRGPWSAEWFNGKPYAIIKEVHPITKERREVFMHKLIVGASDEVHVRHVNGNTLDNRWQNLRIEKKISNCE